MDSGRTRRNGGNSKSRQQEQKAHEGAAHEGKRNLKPGTKQSHSHKPDPAPIFTKERRKRSRLKKDRRKTTRTPQSSFTPLMPDKPRTRSQCVLIVDDHLDNLELMKELLASRGYKVITATNSDEAESTIRSTHPDLILLDVIMPGRSGFELCRQLKDDPETRLIPVVMITGLGDREDRVRGIEAGADDFLVKPIFPEELFARVNSLLKLKEFTDELENAEAVLFSLALGVESRDPYTGDHCQRLARYASDLGRHMGLGEEDVRALFRGGYLHDLGKVSIPDAILKKGSKLTSEEWELMRQHPVTGEQICKPLKSLRRVLPIIRHHHEHWNGSGYPDGLRGDRIPLLARILQVVDIYDALTTERPYKPAVTHEQAHQTMIQESEQGLWDRHIVDEFFKMLALRSKAA